MLAVGIWSVLGQAHADAAADPRGTWIAAFDANNGYVVLTFRRLSD